MISKIALYAVRIVLFVLLFSAGLFVYSVQSWEEPCSAQPTPMVPYPCGEEGR